MYVSLFLFERILQLKTELKLKNIMDLLSTYHQKRNNNLIKFYTKLLEFSLKVV